MASSTESVLPSDLTVNEDHLAVVVAPRAEAASRPTFLTLPQEIRDQIYELVLGGHVVNIEQNSVDIMGRPPRLSHRIYSAKFLDTFPEPYYFSRRWRYVHDTQIRIGVAILQVCHQVYDEARFIPSSCNTFAIQEKADGRILQGLARQNMVNVLAIRNLELDVGYRVRRTSADSDFAIAVEFAAGQMKNLRRVRVRIYQGSKLRYDDTDRKIQYLPPLLESLKPFGKKLTLEMKDKAVELYAREFFNDLLDGEEYSAQEG